jgi:mono/diheme cytochrome c family protein
MKKVKGHTSKRNGYITLKPYNITQRLISFLFFCFLPLALSFQLSSCNSKSSDNNSPKFDQYFIQGKQLYFMHCSNCHQKNGQGLGRVYPPIDTSDYIDKNMEAVVCLIRNGKTGELVVNGKIYNQAMPPFPALSDLEIAQIATYIYNSWNRKQGIIEVKSVSKILSACDTTSYVR